jgi:hypothetical protein
MIALIIHARLFRDRQRKPEPVCRFDQIIVGGGDGGLGRRIQDLAAKGTRNRDRSGQCGGIVEHHPLVAHGDDRIQRACADALDLRKLFGLAVLGLIFLIGEDAIIGVRVMRHL